MVYIKRNEQGQICALYHHQAADMVETLEIDNPEVLEFLGRCDSEKKLEFLRSDLQLIRVLEDLIDILLKKNIITITDFPQSVYDKLLARRNIRKHLTGAIGMEFDDEVK